MTKTLLYFLHGWGGSKDFWDKMTAYLPEYTLRIADAGYYFQPEHLTLPEQDFMAIGHSLGFLQLLKKTKDNPYCKGLFSLNSFPCFAQRKNFPEGVPARLLNLMQRSLERDPRQALIDFNQSCGFSGEVPPADQLNVEAFKAGLDFLAKEDQREVFHKLQAEGKILGMLSGDEDPIMPARKKWIAAQTVLSGGHFLPQTHPEFCAEWLKKHL